MHVEYVDDRSRRPERGPNRVRTLLVVLALTFVLVGGLVFWRRMDEVMLAFVGGVLVGGMVAGVVGLVVSGLIGRRVSALEGAVHTRRTEQREQSPFGGQQGSVFVITPGGGVEQRRLPAQQWRGAEEFEPAPRTFRVVGGGSGRGAGG